MEIHDTSGDELLGINRQVQYKDTDVFICCVAVNAPESIHVEKWANEIRASTTNAPIILVLCKSDLQDQTEDPITEAMLRAKMEQLAFQGIYRTSSKEWEDFNVHKMFKKAICTGYFNKYTEKL